MVLPLPPFNRLLLLAVLLPFAGFLHSVVQARESLPPIENWGDLRHPYGDSLAAAAERALGLSIQEGLLESFFSLDVHEREKRERMARSIYEGAYRLKQTAGIDSLELYLVVLQVAPNTIPAYVEAVRILLERGDTSRAHPLVVQAIRLEPGEEALWALLGEVDRQVGEARKATLALEYALRLSGGSSKRTNAREALAVLYVESGNLARADSLLRADPVASPSWLLDLVRAKRARQNGDIQAALQALHEATSHNEAPAAVFVELAILEQGRGELDAAASAYRRALELAPHERAAHTGLGLIQMTQGDLEGAAVRFAERVRTDPADKVAQFNLGRALLQFATHSPLRADSAYAAAETAFAACIAMGYSEEGARLGRAQARWGQGDLEGAAEDARSLLAVPAYADRAHVLLARVALTREKPREVVDHLQPLRARGMLDAVGLAMLGKAHLELGQTQAAVEVFEAARAGPSGALDVDSNYAVALSQLGRLEEAEAILRRLAQEHPTDPTVLQNLAAVLYKQGHEAEADAIMARIEDQPH